MAADLSTVDRVTFMVDGTKHDANDRVVGVGKPALHVVRDLQTHPMPFSTITGDLFQSGLSAIGHGCNCSGAMGAGIAVEFKRRYPAMYQEYRKRCRDGLFQLGDIFVWEAPDVVIYNLATQPIPGPSATLSAIETSVRAAIADAASRGLPTLGLPRIGAGLGGLAWPDVATLLTRVGNDSDVNLTVVSLPTSR
jgi:O-acetyl-ADP-ribose deacetylase (regulator of RNase III)